MQGQHLLCVCLAGHVKLNRMDKRSQLRCLGDCKDLLSKGASVLFFPEGTRSKDGKMAEFKKVSQACIPLLPLILLGDLPDSQLGEHALMLSAAPRSIHYALGIFVAPMFACSDDCL